MTRNIRLISFVVYALCLLGLPLKMIIDQQNTFKEGTVYKFRCQPVDPNDPFRGKYVRLGFDQIIGPNPDPSKTNTSYGVIEVDSMQYAYISEVVTEYSDSRPMIELLPSIDTDTSTIYLLPFDRLYMNEDKAQKAEDLYRNALRDETQDVYARVYISKKRYLLDDVYVNGVPLKNAVE